MKNRAESLAVLFIIALLGLIVALIIQYSMMSENKSFIDMSKFVSKQLEGSKEDVNRYLEKLEHYKEEEIPSNTKKRKSADNNVAKIKEKNDNITNEINAVVDATIEDE